MERKWLALTPGDTLPLRLGNKVVPLQDQPAPPPVDDGSTLWVSGAAQQSDMKHEAAPKNRSHTFCGCEVCDLERDKRKAWMFGDFGLSDADRRRDEERLKNATMRAMVDTMQLASHPMLRVWVDEKTGEQGSELIPSYSEYMLGKPYEAPKTATGLQMLQEAAARRDAAMARAIDEGLKPQCAWCGGRGHGVHYANCPR